MPTTNKGSFNYQYFIDMILDDYLDDIHTDDEKNKWLATVSKIRNDEAALEALFFSYLKQYSLRRAA